MQVTLQQSSHSPYEKANNLLISVRATLEAHPDPSRVFYSYIELLKNVGLTTIADRIIKNASKAMHNTVQCKYFVGYKFCGFVKILISWKIKFADCKHNLAM